MFVKLKFGVFSANRVVLIYFAMPLNEFKPQRATLISFSFLIITGHFSLIKSPSFEVCQFRLLSLFSLLKTKKVEKPVAQVVVKEKSLS